MPEKSPEVTTWTIELLIGLATTIWGILTYRVWDINKAVLSKVGMKRFDETIETMRRETKEDFRYHQEQVEKMLKDLAKDLKTEIRGTKK